MAGLGTLLLNFHSVPLISTAPTLYSVAPTLNNLFCSYMRMIKRYFFSSISHQVNHMVLRAKDINTPGHPHKDRITQSIRGHKKPPNNIVPLLLHIFLLFYYTNLCSYTYCYSPAGPAPQSPLLPSCTHFSLQTLYYTSCFYTLFSQYIY